MMKKIKHTIYVSAFILGIASTANATPVPFGNNHYEFIEVSNPLVGNNNSWATAEAAAAASTFNSISGHLATITSQAENDFLFGLVSGTFSGFNGAWLGGRDTQGWLAGPENGQNFSYTNWGGSEPNNAGFAYMNIGTLFAGIDPGKWVDDSGVQGVPSSNNPVIGYFVEYEGTSVPVPGAVWLFGSGLLYLIGISKQKKRN